MNKLTAKSIQKALYYQLLSSSEILCPNVWLYNWESDLIQVTKSQYAAEYEIKISRSDFKADFRKTVGYFSKPKKHDVLASEEIPVYSTWNGKEFPIERPSRFFFVAPEGIIKPEELPDYAGLLEAYNWSGKRVSLRTVKLPTRRKNTGKLTDTQTIKLLRSMMFRYWTLRMAADTAEYEEIAEP